MIIFRRGRSKNLRFEPRLHQEREQESRNCPDWRVQSAYHTLGPSSSSDAIGTLEEVPLAAPVDQTLACLQRRQLVLVQLLSYRYLGKCRLRGSKGFIQVVGGKEPLSSKGISLSNAIIPRPLTVDSPDFCGCCLCLPLGQLFHAATNDGFGESRERQFKPGKYTK